MADNAKKAKKRPSAVAGKRGDPVQKRVVKTGPKSGSGAVRRTPEKGRINIYLIRYLILMGFLRIILGKKRKRLTPKNEKNRKNAQKNSCISGNQMVI